MQTYSIFGMQWGDEGKGKAVDYLAQKSDVVVRYQGGNNAGHTIVVNGQKIVLKLLPSGVLNVNAKCILSHGMVIDPSVFLDEVQSLEKTGLTTQHIVISQRAHVIMPYHIAIDEMQESSKIKIGTTKKGIGPCYENKCRRTGIRMMDLSNPSLLKEKIEINLDYYNIIFKAKNLPILKVEDILTRYLELGKKLHSRIQETHHTLLEAVKQNKTVVFEGAQATMLDIDDGFYPFVTSSHPSLGGIGIGTGIPPHYIQKRVGILKAYTSKVGDGPFPTELDNEIGALIREKGSEYGSVTKRPRRCGWLDLVLTKYAKNINDLNHLVVTKFDILSDIAKIYIATGYKYKGSPLTEIPYDFNILNQVTVDYKEFEGFHLEKDISAYPNFQALPDTAKKYLTFIEDALQVPISFVSIGAEREANIWKNEL